MHILKSARARLRAVQVRADALAQAIASFWKTRGPDPVHGGFYGTLDEAGDPIEPRTKAVIPQARHLWAFSTWYELREPTQEIRSLCDGLYAFLINHFREDGTGEFFWMTDEQGRVADKYQCLYGDSFAILGLAVYARVFAHRLALDQALACFQAIDARAHDSALGGYDQHDESFWVKGGAQKETNTHIHLLESFTALAEAGGDALVKDRLNELLDLIAHTLAQPSGYVHTQFLADWTPVGAPQVSYGHDLETAWLLYDAARVLGRTDDPALPRRIMAIGALSGREGFDEARGGYFQSGVPGNGVKDKTKVWWIQAEALLGLLRLYFISGDDEWLAKLEKTLDWIERYQVNKQNGEWYENTDETGQVTGSKRMGHDWKAGYHTLRSLMYASQWIAEQVE